jgi:sodium-dependent phosphate transporter
MEGSVLQKNPTSIWVFVYGMLAIISGLWLMGHRIIKVIGSRITNIHAGSGFTIEFGAAFTTIIASKMGLPISTTHSLVGSVIAVGIIKSGSAINWGLLRNVVLAWLATLPITFCLSAGFTLLFRWIAL